MKKFKKDFLFGGSISGPQTEGVIGKYEQNIFDYWSENNHQDFYNEIDSSTTCNMYNSYKSDIKMMKEIGIKIYRTSIQWTRLIKNFETNEINEEAVKYYRDYFKTVNDEGIVLVVNLYHFDTPMYWHNRGGWENKEFSNAFAQYAKLCFKLFGDLVDLWATMNEPAAVAEHCYYSGAWYPFIKDFKRAAQVAYNQILTNAKIVREFKELFKDDKEKEICVILNNAMLAIPKDSNLENLRAAQDFDLIHNRSYLDPMIKGEFPIGLQERLSEIDALPNYTNDELEMIKNNTIDFLGVNYYAPFRVQSPLKENENKKDITRFCEPYTPTNIRINKSRGWEILPEKICDIAMVIKNQYGNIKWWMSENGMGVMDEEQFMDDYGQIQDDYRIDYIKEHIEQLHSAINDGANCFAYCLWAPIDCWSWNNAFKNRYGLISIDLRSQRRTIKKSGYWFKELSDSKEIK